MDSPLVCAHGPKTLTRQIGTLANADSCVSNQQECISTQIVTVGQFLLKKSVLFDGERPRKALRRARDILRADQVRKIRELLSPGEFVEDAAQTDQ